MSDETKKPLADRRNFIKLAGDPSKGVMASMPGLPKVPSAEVIGLDAKGQIAGLF